MDLDPSVFGPVAAVDVFSAAGDQIGVADIRDRHLDAQFSSPSGGIGRLPKMPVILVTVPVLASAKPGDTASIIAATPGKPWRDVEGNRYLPSAAPAQMKVGGSLSIDSATPGGGLLPAGTRVRIDGRGFKPATAVEVEGVVVRPAEFVGPQAVYLTLGAPADLTGKRVVVRNPDGAQADFYSALRGRLRSSAPETTLWPIFPLRTYVAAGGWPMVQNPNADPIYLTYQVRSNRGVNQFSDSRIVELGPGEIATTAPTIATAGSQTSWSLYSSQPVRMLQFASSDSSAGGGTTPELTAVPPDAITPRLYLDWEGGKPSCSVDPFHGTTSDPPCVAWLVGSAPPKPLVLAVSASALPARFTASATTADGGRWLAISPQGGATCLPSSVCKPVGITINLDPASLAPGEYTAAITITPDSPVYSPQTTALTLRVTTSLISVQGPAFLDFVVSAGGAAPDPVGLQVTSSGDPARFSAFVRNSPDVNGDWLSVAPAEGATPATVTVTANPAALSSKDTGALNYVTVRGPANSVTKQVMLVRRDRLPPPVFVSPPRLVFSIPSGSSTGNYGSEDLAAHTLTVTGNGMPVDSTATVATSDGNAWLTIPPPRYIRYGQVYVAADARNLPPGAYDGALTITAPPGSPHSVVVPVTLNVTAAVPRLLPDAPPLGVTVANGASQTVGAVAAGEILSIHGLNIGPAAPAGFSLDANGNVGTNLNGARVLFGDTPAPILFASQTQVNLVVPFEVAGTPSVDIAVEFEGVRAIAAGVPVAPSAPGIFTADGSGQGQADAANQDGSANNAAHPADRGSTIRVLATGLGQTVPGGVTGGIEPTGGKRPALPVSVTIGGEDATVHDAVSAPGQVDGVSQLHVLVPQRVTPGPSVPIVLRAGSAHSPDGVTIAVK